MRLFGSTDHYYYRSRICGHMQLALTSSAEINDHIKHSRTRGELFKWLSD